jgi:hypothetical protein
MAQWVRRGESTTLHYWHYACPDRDCTATVVRGAVGFAPDQVQKLRMRTAPTMRCTVCGSRTRSLSGHLSSTAHSELTTSAETAGEQNLVSLQPGPFAKSELVLGITTDLGPCTLVGLHESGPKQFYSRAVGEMVIARRYREAGFGIDYSIFLTARCDDLPSINSENSSFTLLLAARNALRPSGVAR